MNTGEPWPDPFWAGRRVRRMQTKLHQWAAEDPGRRFDDLFDLVHHPDFLTVAWERVRGNTGARVFAHIGRPSIRAIDSGQEPLDGEWGSRGAPTVRT